MANCLVIIPTYNEIENIEAIITAIFDLKNSHQAIFHVLVVDDNSPDGTANCVQYLQHKFSSKLFLEKRMGKLGLGTAYIHGFKWALENNYDYIFEMDADFSHNPIDLIRLRDTCINEKLDMVIGSRYVQGVNVVNWPMSRVLLSYIASKYVRFITQLPIHDTTAGFVCYSRKLLQTILLDKIKFIGYAFQIEMKYKAYLHGLKFKEIPVIFTDRSKGVSKMSKGIISEAILGVIQMKIKSLLKR